MLNIFVFEPSVIIPFCVYHLSATVSLHSLLFQSQKKWSQNSDSFRFGG